jgi:hypothetical protein
MLDHYHLFLFDWLPVLDSTSGRPGAEMKVQLDKLTAGGFEKLADGWVNQCRIFIHLRVFISELPMEMVVAQIFFRHYLDAKLGYTKWHFKPQSIFPREASIAFTLSLKWVFQKTFSTNIS